MQKLKNTLNVTHWNKFIPQKTLQDTHCDMKDLLSSKARFPYPPILRRFDIEEPRFKLKAHATNYACAICAYAHYADLNLKLSAVDRSNCEGEGGWHFGYVIFLGKSPKRVH